MWKVKVSVAQLYLTLCDPIDCSLPGSSVHGALQARILEWVAMTFSRGSSWPRDPTWVSCIAGRFFTIWVTSFNPILWPLVSSFFWPVPTLGEKLSRSNLVTHREMLRRRQWHPTPVLLPGESQGQGSLVGCCLWGRTESDTTEAT